MLESLYITKSKIRQDILTLFFTNVSQKYYLRELQRILGHSAGSIRRELLKFQKDNLFNTERVGLELEKEKLRKQKMLKVPRGRNLL